MEIAQNWRVTLIWHLRVFVGLGAVFAALSELWFYPVTDLGGLLELVLYYAIAALAACLVVNWLGGGGGLGFFLVALMLGFAIEAIPVAELYSALPFTLVWTSMAWHGMVSGVLGVWLYRRCWASGIIPFVAVNMLLGTFLGLWGSYFWGSDPDNPPYVDQLLWAFAVFAFGHFVLPSARAPEKGLMPMMWGMVALVAIGFCVGMLWLMFPMSLVLPIALGLTGFSVAGARSDAPLWGHPVLRRSWAMGLLPVAAYLAFVSSFGTQWISDMNAYVILVLGPISVALFSWCFVRAVVATFSPAGRPPDHSGA